jgi:hypothetical protein
MYRPTCIVMILMIALLAFTAPEASVRQRPAAAAGGPWTDVYYSDDGQLESARGYGRGGVRLGVTAEARRHGGTLRHAVVYTRGRENLRIDRVYDSSRGLTVTYQTDTEKWTLSLLPDLETGEALALYTLDDGQVHSLWLDAGGEIVSGDARKLRESLRAPSRIGRLLRQYARDRQTLAGSLPVVGDEAMGFMPMKGCNDACAEGCGSQCAWECAFWGWSGCRICQVSCAIGCAIGC